MENKTHYKKLLNPEYLGAYSLDDGKGGYNEVDIIITSVTNKDVIGDGGAKKNSLIANTNFGKPLILNSTNRKVITLITKSNYVEDWRNINVTLFVQRNVRDPKGGTTDGLRIKKSINRVSVDYSKQIELIKNCGTLDELKKVYTGLTGAEQAGTLQIKDEMKGLLS